MDFMGDWDLITVHVCDNCGGVVGLRAEPGANCGRMLREVDYVPAEQLAEVMKERDELRNMLIRVLDAVALLDHPQDAVAEAVAIMRAARGHYGVEETGGPGQAATEWDEIADRMKTFVYRYGEQQE